MAVAVLSGRPVKPGLLLMSRLAGTESHGLQHIEFSCRCVKGERDRTRRILTKR
jgi:hypothetical protein